MKKFLLFIVCMFILIGITSCSQKTTIDESGNEINSGVLKREKWHFYSKYDPEIIIITNISKEDQQKILTAFDIVIPEKESNACVLNFVKLNRSNDFDVKYRFYVEFDGVEDYTNFYEANRHRKMLTGADDITFNEMMDEEQRYYLTFTYLYDEDIEDEFYPVYNSLFNELNEKYNS